MSLTTNPRWAKTLGDIRRSPWRCLLVTLAVIIGTAAMTAGLLARIVLERGMTEGYAATQPAAASLTIGHVDDSVLALARNVPGVVSADARRVTYARALIGPGDWRPLRLFVVRDVNDVRVATFQHVSGARTPKTGEILVERSSLPVLQAREGDLLSIRAPGGHQASLRIAGLVHDAAQAPGWQDNIGYAHLGTDTFALLGQDTQLDQLLIAVRGERDEAARVASNIARELQTAGQPSAQIEVTTRQHPHAEHMRGSLLLIAAFGTVALIMSGALTATVFSGLLARQTRQIGVMKALGARSGQVFGMYGVQVVILASAGVLIGVALGRFAANALCTFAAADMNLQLQSLVVPFVTLAAVAAIAFAIPTLTAFMVVRRAVSITPRAALTDVGITPPPGAGTTRWNLGDRRHTLALRNNWRRPRRLAATIAMLSLGGVTLMTGANLHGSLVAALDDTLAHRLDSLEMRLLRPIAAGELESRVAAIDGVQAVESWGNLVASIQMHDSAGNMRIGTERYGVLAAPAQTKLLRTPMLAGHWPERPGEVAVNQAILAREPILQVGSQVTLLAGSHATTARVVGLVAESAEPHLYAARSVYDELIGQPGTASGVRVLTDAGREEAVARAIEELAVELDSLPVFSETRRGYRAIMIEHYAPLLALLLMAAAAAIIVGGFALAANASMNVLERAVEIGVMRAIGGRRATILGILLLEGACATGASVVLAIAISLPLTSLVGNALGSHSLHTTLPFVIAPWGVAVWVITAALITLLACTTPALSALRRPVRDVLSYE